MANPIIQRELIGMLRTRKALAVLVSFTAVLGALVLVRWPSAGRMDLDGTQARQVLRVFGYGLMVGLILLAPIFPATSIVKEKSQGTLALLLNSPMKPWTIVSGKLAGALGYVLLLVLVSVPAAAACYAMGGIYLGQLLRMYLVLGLLAVSYASLGLLISSYAANTNSAMRLTYGLILLLAVVSLGPHQFLQGQPWVPHPAAVAVQWLRALSPIPAMMAVLGDLDVGTAGLEAGTGVAVRFMILAAIMAVGLSCWTGVRLSGRMLDRSRAAGRITDEQSAGVQRYRRVMFLWFFDPQRRGGLIGARWVPMLVCLAVAAVCACGAVYVFTTFDFNRGFTMNLLGVLLGSTLGFAGFMAGAGALWLAAAMNPVTVKEQKTNRFGRSHWLMRLIGGCAIVSLLLMLATAQSSQAWGVETLGGIMVLLQVVLVVLLTPSLASGLISSEIESRSWQLLQVTPLHASRIIRGKLMSVVITLSLVLLATLPGYAVMIAIDPNQSDTVGAVLLSLALTAVMSLLVSGAMSSLFKTTAAATTASYAFLITLCAGTMLFWLGQNAPFGPNVVEAILMVNPLAAALNLIQTPGFARYELVPGNWYVMIGLSVACLVVLVVRTWQLTRPR